MSSDPSIKFTRQDAAALWHAVDNYALMVREMAKDAQFAKPLVEREKDRVQEAKAALRKVQALRRGDKQAAA